MANEPQDRPRLLADLVNLVSFANIRSEGPDPQPSPLEQLLAELHPPPPSVIRDRWFNNQTIRIDGYTFELRRHKSVGFAK